MAEDGGRLRPLRLVIVGGGITGLAAAHEALRRARETGRVTTVTVLEKASRFGGNVLTERAGGFVLDAGPDSWVVTKPHATALAREVGLESSLVGTREGARRFYVAYGGRLHAVPEGIVLGVPTRLAPLVRTRLFSPLGKLRMACEPFVQARRFEDDEDESIADFAVRRLGREAADRLVAPLLGGISAGDASDLSVRAAFPQFIAMEREHGSLVRAMLASRRARERSQPVRDEGAFRSLAGGVGELPAAVVEHVRRNGGTLRAGVTLESLVRAGSAWTVGLSGGERIEADAVLLAVPAYAAGALLRATDASVADDLDAMAFGSTATVFLGYRRDDVAHPLDGVGFVVPRSQGRSMLAATWVSSKWAGRAPEGHVLLRAFFSPGEGDARGDASLVQLARAELLALMSLEATPVLSRVFRYDHASPQMRVGHLGRVRRIRERLAAVAPGLRVAGGGYEGIGIPDCVRQGREAAKALLEAAAS